MPDVVKKLVGAGWKVCVQAGAGTAAAVHRRRVQGGRRHRRCGRGSRPVRGAAWWYECNAPSAEEAKALPDGAAVLSFFQVGQSEDALRALAAKKATVFSFDLLPRISRAQSMDALSSQATVSGYRAGLAAAEHLAKFFPMFMTAAGTVPPAKVLVMGVGVAGLQSIATARRLGAVVKAYDVRAAAKEEAESLGATFVDTGVSAERGRRLRPGADARGARPPAGRTGRGGGRSDVVITTAAVPAARPRPGDHGDGRGHGRTGPSSSTWRPTQGGNCELTRAGEVVDHNGVHVVGHDQPAVGHADPCQLPVRPQHRQRPRR